MAQDDYMGPENDDNDSSNFGTTNMDLAVTLSTFHPEFPADSSDQSQNGMEGEKDSQTASTSSAHDQSQQLEIPPERKIRIEPQRIKRRKAKHKRSQELLVAQREKKKLRLENLKRAKLSDEILERLSETKDVVNIQEDKNEPDVSAEILPMIMADIASPIENSQVISVDEGKPKKKPRRRRSKHLKEFTVEKTIQPVETLDFIPLTSRSTEFHVNVLNKKVDTVVCKTASLLDLKNRLMFGKANRREPAIKAAAKLKKQSQSGINVYAVI